MSTESVLNHLLFHKALISEENGGERINEYMRMVNELKQGAYTCIKDPFDREIAIVFELAVEQQLNPWDIDLIKFSTLFLKRVREEKILDLVTAGHIILMAWTILKLQSDEALEHAKTVQEEEFTWESIPEDWDVEEQGYDFTTAVLHGESPIEEKVRRKGMRKVTLIELVEALEEAKATAERHARMLELRERENRLRKIRSKEDVDEKLHKEDIEEDINYIWQKICRFDGKPIPLSELHNGESSELIRTFISVLFLANHENRKIKVWQKEFPFGQIYVQNLVKES